jgi:hypothetical protein
MARSEAILRKERTELRARLQALEDAQLSDVERKDQALVRAQEEVAEKTRLNQSLRLQIAIADKVRERNLVSAAAVQALLMNDFRQEIVDDPELETVAHLVDLLVEKYDFLQQQTPGTQPPASGRSMSPARAPTGQYAQKPVEPVPYSKFERLGDLTKEDWENAAKKSGQQ